MNFEQIDWLVISRNAIRQYWSFLIGSAAVGVILAAVYLFFVTPRYLISAVLTSSHASSNVGQLASLGSAFGLRVGNENADYFPEFLTTLTSVEVAHDLAAQGWLQRIYPSLWDAARQQWRSSRSIRRDILGALGREPPAHPTAYDLHTFLSKSFKEIPVSSGGDSTSMTEIDFYYKNPMLGVSLMHAAINDADQIIQRRATRRAQETVAYLEAQLSGTNQPELRTTIYSMLAAQEAAAIGAASQQSFASRIVVPPNATPSPVQPAISVALLFGFLGGGLVGFLWGFGLSLRNVQK